MQDLPGREAVQALLRQIHLAWLERRPHSDIHHYELLGGYIVMTPPAGFPHSPIAVCIGAALYQHVAGRKLGIVNDSSAGFQFGSIRRA